MIFKLKICISLVFSILLGHLINCSGWKKLEDITCNNHNNKLLSLLNLLCNSTQTTSVQVRDGCYGCFFRAANLPGGQQQLQALNQCANLYLTNTIYVNCARELALVTNGTRPTTAPTTAGCYTGYCDFVRCVRQTNANVLIDDCVRQNMMGRNFDEFSDRIYWYTNTTSCILARARCSRYNPISGELQQQDNEQQNSFKTKLTTFFHGGPITYSNSLQVTPNSDIRIISFPSTIHVADLFCSRSPPALDQSNYRDFAC